MAVLGACSVSYERGITVGFETEEISGLERRLVNRVQALSLKRCNCQLPSENDNTPAHYTTTCRVLPGTNSSLTDAMGLATCERLVSYRRKSSTSTAPCTPRRLVTVPRASRSCENFPDGFDPHLQQIVGTKRVSYGSGNGKSLHSPRK